MTHFFCSGKIPPERKMNKTAKKIKIHEKENDFSMRVSQSSQSSRDQAIRGIVVLRCEDEAMKDDQTRKLHIQCLYHAKGISEYVVIWDIDELWMPPLEGGKAKAAAQVPWTDQSHVARHSLCRYSWAVTLTPNEEKLQSPYTNTLSLIEAGKSVQGEKKMGVPIVVFRPFLAIRFSAQALAQGVPLTHKKKGSMDFLSEKLC
jgi:hypothetical protein